MPDPEIVIIGAGLTGSALAYHLAQRSPRPNRITIIDRTMHTLQGSTADDSGLILPYSESAVLATLAHSSATAYAHIPAAFTRTGALEFATTLAQMERLAERRDLATQRGVTAQLLAPAAAATLAPLFLPRNPVLGGLLFPAAGTVDTRALVSWYRTQATLRGVTFLEANVAKITPSPTPEASTHTLRLASGDEMRCATLVLAAGIWTPNLAADAGMTLPQHAPTVMSAPYIRGRAHEARIPPPMPWVQLDGARVRDTDTADEILCTPEPADALFDALDMPSARVKLVPTVMRRVMGALRSLLVPVLFEGARRPVHSLCAGTGDGVPVVGTLGGGVFVCAGVDVGVLDGCAQFLARMISGEEVDDDTASVLSPARFRPA